MYLYSDEALSHLIPSRNLNNSITWNAPTNDDPETYLYRYEALSYLIPSRNSNKTITWFYPNNSKHYTCIYTVMSHFRA